MPLLQKRNDDINIDIYYKNKQIAQTKQNTTIRLSLELNEIQKFLHY